MPTVSTLLCVTTDPAVTDRVRQALGGTPLRVEIHQATDAAALRALIATLTPDVVLIDLLTTGASDGLVRAAVQASPDHPVVFLSGPTIVSYGGERVAAILGPRPWTFTTLLERLSAQGRAAVAAGSRHSDPGAA